MEKLQQLMDRCKCGVHLTVNAHRDSYENAEKALNQLSSTGCLSYVADYVYAEMVARDTIIDLQFYPDTPVGSYSVFHYDLDAALDIALESLV